MSITTACDDASPTASPTLVPTICTAQRYVNQWRAGKERGAEAIYRRYGHHVRRVVRFHLNRRFHVRCDEEDAMQVVFMEVFRRLQNGADEFGSDDRFVRWIRAVARNRTIKLIKFQSAHRRAVDRENRTSSSTLLRNVPDRRAQRKRSGLHVGVSDLKERLGKLGGKEQLIVEMLQQRLTQEEMAERLGCTARTVRRRLRRIREQLGTAA